MPTPDRRRRITAFVVAIAVLIATPLVVVASDTFGDVADSNVHHDDITWLADAAVTLGCNPPDNTNFCPGDPVTRQQMASFLRRLAENQVVDAATSLTAQTADMLAGEGPDAYRTVVAADLDSELSGNSEGDFLVINTVTISAPAAGTIVVSGSALLHNETGSNALLGLRPAVNGTVVPGAGGNATYELLPNDAHSSLAYTVAFEVGAGNHTVTQGAGVLNVSGEPMGGSFFYNANNLTATWHPEGSVSLATAGTENGSGLLGG